LFTVTSAEQHRRHTRLVDRGDVIAVFFEVLSAWMELRAEVRRIRS